MRSSPQSPPLSPQHLPTLPTTFLAENRFAPLPSACGSTKPSPLQTSSLSRYSWCAALQAHILWSFFLFFLFFFRFPWQRDSHHEAVPCAWFTRRKWSSSPESCSLSSDGEGQPDFFFSFRVRPFFRVRLQAFYNVRVPGLPVRPRDPRMEPGYLYPSLQCPGSRSSVRPLDPRAAGEVLCL